MDRQMDVRGAFISTVYIQNMVTLGESMWTLDYTHCSTYLSSNPSLSEVIFRVSSRMAQLSSPCKTRGRTGAYRMLPRLIKVGVYSYQLLGSILILGHKEFYLILNVAAGGTTGWFPDWQGNKPWINGEPSEFMGVTRY